jgi:hypothetical protein
MLDARWAEPWSVRSDALPLKFLTQSPHARHLTYFTALIEQRSMVEAQWQVACRSPEEWPAKHVLLASLGIDPTMATPVLWDTLEAS